MSDDVDVEALVRAAAADGLVRLDPGRPCRVELDVRSWRPVLEAVHAAGLTWFDHLTAVDEPDSDRIAVVLAVASPQVRSRLAVRTRVPREGGSLPSVADLWAGAEWAEREAWEMVGVGFDGHPHLVRLLLPDDVEGHPLRHDVLLAARQSTPWPGRKDPADRRLGEGPPARAASRRRPLPPGVAGEGTT